MPKLHGPSFYILLLGCFTAAVSCAGAEKRTNTGEGESAATLPSKGSKGSATAPAVATIAAAETETERHIRHACDFEQRGVIDRAAISWQYAHQSTPNPEHLLHAAELFEQALARERAKKAYDALAEFPSHSEIAKQGSTRTAPSEADQAFPTEEEQRATYDTLVRARDRVAVGDLLGARSLLQTEALRNENAAWALLGAIHWRLGKHRLAQRAWSIARSTGSPYYLASRKVQPIPPIDFAPVQFAATDQAILLAAANRELFRYLPELGVLEMTGQSIEGLGLSPPGVEGPQLPALWTLPGAGYEGEYGQPVEARVSPAGDRVAWRDENERLKLLSHRQDGGFMHLEWTKEVGTVVDSPPWRTPLSLGVCFSANGSAIYAGSSEGEIFEFDITGKQKRKWKAHDGKPVNFLATSPDGKWLASRGADRSIVVWDLKRLEPRKTLAPEREIRSLAFFPNSDTLEFARPWELARVDWRTGEAKGSYSHGRELLRVDHSPNGRWTAIGHYKTESLNLLRGNKLEPEFIKTNQVSVVNATSSADGSTIATTSAVGTHLFDTETWTPRRLNKKHAFGVPALAADGSRVAVPHEQSVTVYDSRTGKPIVEIPTTWNHLDQLGFISHRELLITTDVARIHDVATGAVQFSPKGVTRYHSLKGGSLRFSDLGWQRFDARGEAVGEFDCDRDGVTTNAGRTHFTCISNSELTVISIDGNRSDPAPLADAAKKIALSADGLHVALTLGGSRVYFVNIKNGTWIGNDATEHAGLHGLTSLAYVGRFLFYGGSDGVYAQHVDRLEQRGSLHFLTSGEWFTLSHTDPNVVFTDGDPKAIVALAGFPPGTPPGVLFEGRRREGSFRELLSGTLPKEDLNYSVEGY